MQLSEHDKLNRKAFDDVSACREPTMPYNPEYMRCYDSWCPLQIFPGDEYYD